MTDIFALIEQERRQMADDAERLTDAQWTTPSALSGWQVKHVMAHMVWPVETSTLVVMGQMLRNGFNFNKTADWVAGRDTRTAAQLAKVLRDKAAHRFTPPGLGPEAPLTDAVVHSMDIRKPLGIKHDVAPEAAKIVLSHLVKPGQAKFFGVPVDFHFAADDLDWSHGTGPKVTGSMDNLMLALTHRKMGMDAIKGDGAAAFCAKAKP